MKLKTVNNFKELVLEDTPLIDVRAPIEFEKGAFKNAVNLPLMNNEERRLIGIRYKNNGNEAALKLGYKLVSGDIKKARVDAWIEFIKQNPNAVVYCFRGGQRSQIVQRWLKEKGVDVARIEGGYKAFRGYLIEQLDNMQGQFKPVRLGGRTGSGKTILLHKLQNSIDLEGLANHRGSAFGKHISPQPTQINFENSLAYELLHKINKNYKTLVFEDEGKNIGRVYLPQKLYEFINNSGLILLDTPLEKRIEITFNEYVVDELVEYQKLFKSRAIEFWSTNMLDRIDKIERRLGGKRYKEIREFFNLALKEHINSGNLEKHKLWIEPLLVKYYDPMYDYQISKKEKNILFRGGEDEVIEYLRSFSSC